MTNAFTRRVGRYVALPAAAMAIAGTAALGLAATSNAAPGPATGGLCHDFCPLRPVSPWGEPRFWSRAHHD